MDQETKAIEKGLAKQIRRFFTGLQRKIIKEYSDTSEEYLSLLPLQLQIIIEKEWSKYEDVLLNYNQKAATIGLLYNKLLTDYSFIHAREVGLAAKSENMKDIFSTNESVSDKIMNNTFEASDKVKSRVTSEINSVLADAYRDSLGREDVTKKINEKFTQLKAYESRRIAVTEINSNRNVANYTQIQNDGVKYKQWVTAEDGRVRPTHMDLNGHIVRTSDKFSNGLAHPGDKNGPIREWVNCRCVLLPYFVPWGMKAPDMVEFTEDELLVDDNTGTVNDYLNKFKGEAVSNDVHLNEEIATTPVKDVKVDSMGITGDGYGTIQNFVKKHGKKKTEYGAIFDLKTGEIYSPVFHGGKGSVSVPEQQYVYSGLTEKEIKKIKKEDPMGWLTGKYEEKAGDLVRVNYVKSDNCAVIHNHPKTGYNNFSDADLNVTYSSKKIDYCVAVSENHSWIVKINKNTSQSKMNEVLVEWKTAYKKVEANNEKEINSKLKEIAKIGETDAEKAKKELDKLKKYMDDGSYDKHVNVLLNKEYLKIAKKYPDVLTLKHVSNKDLQKIINELNNKEVIKKKATSKLKPKTKTKSKNKPKKETKTKFKKSDYEKNNTRNTIIVKQDRLQKAVNYTEDEVQSMTYWGHSGYNYINGQICDTSHYRRWLTYVDDKGKSIKEINEHIKNMDSAIKKSPGLTQNTVLYRCGHWDTSLKKGDIGSFKGYSSTTYDSSVQDIFEKGNRYKIKIYADKGSKGIRLNSQFDAYESEKEWLLPRNQKFEVLKVDDVKQTVEIRLIA